MNKYFQIKSKIQIHLSFLTVFTIPYMCFYVILHEKRKLFIGKTKLKNVKYLVSYFKMSFAEVREF